ncbi:MAG: hypothetical protein K2P12_00460 [Clostridia bacterium]|nr:hypothetical protein [Clostridia bacterium]
MDKYNKRECAVCGELYEADMVWNGECPNCGWYNNLMGEDNEDKVIFPNIISLKKAQELYKQGKPFKPSLDDFLEGFMFYSEMQFKYKNFDCDLFATNNVGEIEFNYNNYQGQSSTVYYLDRNDFIQNAKIGDEYVRDIWDEVIDPNYM